MTSLSSLPIDDVLAPISAALGTHNRLLLAAPPGAGKTTRIPLHLWDMQSDRGRRILVLEPRRLAARGAAQRMAESLGEKLGETVGLSTRLERHVSDRTRIEVITDGLFTRRILADPELANISTIIFDEFHERSLSLDLGLTLARETQAAFREDLKLICMSATLNTDRLAEQFDAPVITSEGRAFPIETKYAGRPKDNMSDHVAQTVLRACAATDGDILVFLPGAAEIRRVRERLGDHLPARFNLHPLYGALPPQAQDLALKRAPQGQRKIILSTDIAESALTIPGVQVVVDSGLCRVPLFDPNSGRARLTTERASRASVDQRRGRAGRTAPGVCYRLWDEAETRGLTADITPEILRSDLAGLVLALADWGESDASSLAWVDPPPTGRLDAATAHLKKLGALDQEGRITENGRALAKLPLPPALANLIVCAADPGTRRLGAEIAALLSERGLGGSDTDLAARLDRFRRESAPRAKALRRQAERWGGKHKATGDPAHLIARAWPHAIAKKRSSTDQTYLTAGGDAVVLTEGDLLAKHDWLVVAEAMGHRAGARVTLAAPIQETDLLEICSPVEAELAQFEPTTQSFKAERTRRIGAILVSTHPLPRPSGDAARSALLSAITEHGFTVIGAQADIETFLARMALVRQAGEADLPAWTSDSLAASSGDWLVPQNVNVPPIPTGPQITARLSTMLDWSAAQALNRFAPDSLVLPSGRRAPLDYQSEHAPLVSAKMQEFYGLTEHPHIARKTPVTLSLLSPAGRPIALTRDIGRFWTGGYLDARKDMRARYPKHDWPEHPDKARPHEGRTKARLARD